MQDYEKLILTIRELAASHQKEHSTYTAMILNEVADAIEHLLTKDEDDLK